MKHSLMLLGVTVALAGCATLTEKQCRIGDWSSYGKIDGARGRPATYWQEHEAACGKFGMTVDRAAYAAGWKDGLANYCTAESGYYAGVIGETYYGVCAGDAEKVFRAQYDQGRRIHQLNTDLQSNDTELNELRAKHYQDTSTGETVLDMLGLTVDSARRHELEDRHRYLAGELTELESAAPSASPLRAEVTTRAIGAGFGAVTGTFLGFGVGHAIQGRYFERGWLFTALEAGTLAASAIGGSATCGSSACQNALGGVGTAIFIGLKIWESIDVWRYYSAAQAGYPHLSESFTPSTPLFALAIPLTL